MTPGAPIRSQQPTAGATRTRSQHCAGPRYPRALGKHPNLVWAVHDDEPGRLDMEDRSIHDRGPRPSARCVGDTAEDRANEPWIARRTDPGGRPPPRRSADGLEMHDGPLCYIARRPAMDGIADSPLPVALALRVCPRDGLLDFRPSYFLGDDELTPPGMAAVQARSGRATPSSRPLNRARSAVERRCAGALGGHRGRRCPRSGRLRRGHAPARRRPAQGPGRPPAARMDRGASRPLARTHAGRPARPARQRRGRPGRGPAQRAATLSKGGVGWLWLLLRRELGGSTIGCERRPRPHTIARYLCADPEANRRIARYLAR